MKVKCVQLLNERTGQSQTYSYWLTVGAVYHVLEMLFGKDGRSQVRLIGKEAQTPALFNLQQFEIVSPKLPANWIVVTYSEGSYTLAPEAWTEKNFWQMYFDREPEALRKFEEERKKIIAFDP